MDGRPHDPRLGDPGRTGSDASGFFGDVSHRGVDGAGQTGRPDAVAFCGVSLHGGGLHLRFGAGLLRLRGAGESETRRVRQCAVVGVDERYDRRCGDLSGDGRREGGLRAAAVAGDDVLPDLHDLYIAGVYAAAIESFVLHAFVLDITRLDFPRIICIVITRRFNSGPASIIRIRCRHPVQGFRRYEILLRVRSLFGDCPFRSSGSPGTKAGASVFRLRVWDWRRKNSCSHRVWELRVCPDTNRAFRRLWP